MFSSTSHAIKTRKLANDVFYTPRAVSKIAIDFINIDANETWLDPWKGTGSFYDQFPTPNKRYCEIDEGIDFYVYKKRPTSFAATRPTLSSIVAFKKS